MHQYGDTGTPNILRRKFELEEYHMVATLADKTRAIMPVALGFRLAAMQLGM